MLSVDSRTIPAPITAHTGTNRAKQFPVQKTARPHPQAPLHNAAMEHIASVGAGAVRALITVVWRSGCEEEMYRGLRREGSLAI